MSERIIPVDLSPLWRYEPSKFTLRYLDIDETKRDSLAQVFKTKATHRRIRARTGPSINEIKKFLEELNPIIFSTGDSGPFNSNSRKTIERWHFHTICKAIYWFIVLKKRVDSGDFFNLMWTSALPQDRQHSDHDAMDTLRNAYGGRTDQILEGGQRILAEGDPAGSVTMNDFDRLRNLQDRFIMPQLRRITPTFSYMPPIP